MNKWIVLFATILITTAFATTINTTIANPIGTNIAISSVLAILIVAGLFVFSKSGNKIVKQEDEFTPA